MELAFRNDLTLEKAYSIGFRSGLYTGRNLTIAPVEYTSCRILSRWCTDALSKMTTEWLLVPLNGLRIGSRLVRTKSSKMLPFTVCSVKYTSSIPLVVSIPIDSFSTDPEYLAMSSHPLQTISICSDCVSSI